MLACHPFFHWWTNRKVLGSPYGFWARRIRTTKLTSEVRAGRPLSDQVNQVLHVDAVAIEIGGLLDAEEGPDDTESEEDDLESEEDDDFGAGDDSSVPSDSERWGPPSDSEDEAIASGGPNTWIRDQYKEYARGQVGNTIPFNKEEEASIRLMDVLNLKKSPLNAYKSLVE